MAELLILSLAGVVAMTTEFFKGQRLLLPLALLALASVAGLCVVRAGEVETLYGMASLDAFSRPFLVVLCGLGMLWFWGFRRFFDNEKTASDFVALFLFSFAGAACLTFYTNLTMLFLGIEILSIPIYVMAGSRKTDVAGNEASFKYFLIGAFASCFLLFGIALLYGATGSFDLAAIASQASSLSPEKMALLQAGFLLTLAAFAFKISAVPFHFWAPDTYQGAPIPVTAFMSTIVKIAAFAGLLKFISAFQNAIPPMAGGAIYALCILTMLVANFVASAQQNAKRLLAFSSVSHTGFMLAGIFSQQVGGERMLVFYALVYGISSLAAFRVLWLLGENATVQSFKGLLSRNPLAAVTMILALLSMAGIPPMSGFIAKYLVLAAALAAGHPWLVVAGIVASLVAIWYYFRIIAAMFSEEGEAQGSLLPVEAGDRVFFAACSVLLLGLGVFPLIL